MKKENNRFIVKNANENIPSNTLKTLTNKVQISDYEVIFGNEGIPVSDFLESIFPKGETFEDLAEKGGKPGLSKLGVLAMDVDNLGLKLEKVASSIEHKIFDEKLKTFFNQDLKNLLEQQGFRNNVYVVTAGGDDSFFVGKWNTMLELADKITIAFKKKFKEEERKENLTISSALTIVKPSFPVVLFAQLADKALKDAKYKYENQKGNLNLFGEVLDWEVFKAETLKLRMQFNGYRRDLVTSGLLAKARHTALKVAEGQGMQLSDFWQMSYYMRNFKPIKKSKWQKEEIDLMKSHRESLNEAEKETQLVKKRTYKLVFPIAARLAEFDARN